MRHPRVHLAFKARPVGARWSSSGATERCLRDAGDCIRLCTALLFYLRAQAWLEESLESLDKSLRDMGSRLILRVGGGHVTLDTPSSEQLAVDAASQLVLLAEQSGSTRVFYHRAYTPEGSLEQVHMARNITTHPFL